MKTTHTNNLFVDLRLACLLFLVPIHTSAGITFEDATVPANVANDTESWGVSWGDFNGDGTPDVYVSNHKSTPSLYINQGNGTFVDNALAILNGNLDADTHGVGWGDFDSDGDMDLMQMVGGSSTTNPNGINILYMNQAGVLNDVAAQWGVDLPAQRGRTPLWVDWTNDGLLDLVLAGQRPKVGIGETDIYENTGTSFASRSQATGFDCTGSTRYATLSDLSGDGVLDLICVGQNFPRKVYDLTGQPLFNDITSQIPTTTSAYDAAIEDFNGDQKPDIFVSRNRNRRSNVVLTSPLQLVSHVVVNGQEKGFDFKSSGLLSINIGVVSLPPQKIFIGSTGYNPNVNPAPTTPKIFSISSTDPINFGLAPHTPGVDQGVYIGYDNATGTWQARVSSDKWQNLTGYFDSANPITDLQFVGFNPGNDKISPRMLYSSASGYQDRTTQALLNAPVTCTGVVAGDFDNDADVDLYRLCEHAPANIPNILYENQGDGTFAIVANAGGAAGSSIGTADSAATADYDGDGFLDIFVTNGFGYIPIASGPNHLFRNTSGDLNGPAAGNHWIAFDLVGTVSNPQGIGARVLLTDGSKTQLRERSGGMHLYSQNHMRIHFGLGPDLGPDGVVDSVTINWPSGIQQTLSGLAADQVYQIVETGGASSAAIGDFVWSDSDGNGIQGPGEPGRMDVVVNLLDCNNQFVTTTTTDANGAYTFSALAAGSYKIQFMAPPNTVFSPQFQGSGATDSNPKPSTGITGCLPMADGQTRVGIDAGLIDGGGAASGRIGDFVWNDLDANGVQAADEPGVAGATVNLLDCSLVPQQSTTTGADGSYIFNNVAAGSYRVEFILPPGFAGYSPNFQAPGAIDSNPNPNNTGRTGCLPMADGQQRLGIDAGLIAQ